ncbi:hypothetical protein Ancab_027011 [Ancistrocladus abbreviatus]
MNACPVIPCTWQRWGENDRDLILMTVRGFPTDSTYEAYVVANGDYSGAPFADTGLISFDKQLKGVAAASNGGAVHERLKLDRDYMTFSVLLATLLVDFICHTW